MAINISDFNKIWASTSPLTPYSFSDANYQQGWNFVGATPPARQMWDYIQKNNDEKAKYIVDNFLPLIGGTMTGAITLQNGKGYLRSYSNGTYLYGDTGNSISSVVLYTNEDGSGFRLIAGNGTTSTPLVGKPDGTLTWNNKNIEHIESSGTNYIRYVSGLQICWGEMSVPGTAVTDDTITFPQAFNSGSSYQVAVSRSLAYNWNEDYYIKSYTATGFTWSTIGTVSTNTHGYKYIAIGLWK